MNFSKINYDELFYEDLDTKKTKYIAKAYKFFFSLKLLCILIGCQHL